MGVDAGKGVVIYRSCARLFTLIFFVASQAYNKVARRDEGTDDDIRPWLAGFVQEKGPVAAKTLLAGVGYLESVAASTS
jgi:hypothetical protein